MANVQHPANLLPPSPPVSIEEQKKHNGVTPRASVEYSTVPINLDISESDEDHMSPLARIAREMDADQDRTPGYGPDRSGAFSPASESSRSQASTNSRSSAGSRSNTGYRKHSSAVSRGGMSDGTTMSVGSSLHSYREPSLVSSRDSLALSSVSSQSNGSYSHRSRTRGSRLRQEVLRSPDVGKVDLFKFTKSRLSDVPYHHPQALDNRYLTNNDLRRQMLSTIFGWEGEAETMVRDEMSRHPPGSTNRLLLAKWVGDIETDIMAAGGTESMTSSDWMLLALSGIGGQASQAKVARAYVQRLLEKGDVHTASTIMIGMGDQNDAIEIYVSHKLYMEALILTCLVFPGDWQRQAELVRKWGEWAVQHSQQQLAIRCFSCTGSEPVEPWTSPTAQAATFSPLNRGIPELLSPPLSPPGERGPQRSIAKTSALKLITSFGDKAAKSKFFGAGEDERTPVGGQGGVGGGVTPIAESALSPGGDTAHTAFLRPGHRSTFNTPITARTTTPGGFSRQRLPSIGETPADVILTRQKLNPARLPTPQDSGSEKAQHDLRNHGHERQSSLTQLSAATYSGPISRAATASPMVEKHRERTFTPPLPSPSPGSFTSQKRDARTRNGSRGRKPDGLQIQWPPMESIITGDYMTSPDVSVTSSKYRPARSRAGSTTSRSTAARTPLTSQSFQSLGNQSPAVSGRSIDQYISSLESAQYLTEKPRRHASRDRQEKSSRARSSSRKGKSREKSEDRGRSAARYINPAKRSPTSPVPMSPEDLRGMGVPGYDDASSTVESKTPRARSTKASSRVRQASVEPSTRKPASRTTSRAKSRRRSPVAAPVATQLTLVDYRGRSESRGGSTIRSPSSPLPMSPQAKFYQDDEDTADLKRAREDQKRFRSRQRSTSRLRGTSTRREGSPDRRHRERSSSRKPEDREKSRTRREQIRTPNPEQSHARSASELNAGSLVKDERTLKKEAAARELEERRKSLARRPSVPPIVHPQELAQLSPMSYQPQFPRDNTRSPAFSTGTRSQTSSPALQRQSKDVGNTSPQIGLPATPRAMRHPQFDPDGAEIPDVPQIPEKYDNPQPPSWGGANTLSYNNAFESLAPLPSSVYQAAFSPRRMPPRSASAPIPEEPFHPRSPLPLPAALPTHPAFQAALPPSNRRRTQDSSSLNVSPRKITPGSSQPGTLGYETLNNRPVYASGNPNIMTGIDETLEANHQPLNPNNNNLQPPPPPPPPAPPVLKELAHLQMPPPPPPPPMYRPNNPNTNTNSVVSGISSQGSGVIEIVMDDDDEAPPAPANDSPPAPPQAPFARTSSVSHSRGRSENDNTLTGRFSRAAERIRSASRGRNQLSPQQADRTKSPIETSPYESVPAPWNPAAGRGSNSNTMNGGGGMEGGRHPREIAAAMRQSEGGMI